MWIGIISLFPEMFRAITDYGVTGRAVKNGLLSIQSWSPRDFTHDRHRTVDDRPYGGGPGMLMMVQPLRDAIHAAKAAAGEGAKVIYLSPQGRKLDQFYDHLCHIVVKSNYFTLLHVSEVYLYTCSPDQDYCCDIDQYISCRI